MHKSLSPRVLLAAVALTSSPLLACEYHQLLNIPEPVGVWLADPTTSISDLSNRTRSAAPLVTDLAITGWKLNTTGAKAHSTDATIQSYVQNITADVDRVAAMHRLRSMARVAQRLPPTA